MILWLQQSATLLCSAVIRLCVCWMDQNTNRSKHSSSPGVKSWPWWSADFYCSKQQTDMQTFCQGFMFQLCYFLFVLEVSLSCHTSCLSFSSRHFPARVSRVNQSLCLVQVCFLTRQLYVFTVFSSVPLSCVYLCVPVCSLFTSVASWISSSLQCRCVSSCLFPAPVNDLCELWLSVVVYFNLKILNCETCRTKHVHHQPQLDFVFTHVSMLAWQMLLRLYLLSI